MSKKFILMMIVGLISISLMLTFCDVINPTTSSTTTTSTISGAPIIISAMMPDPYGIGSQESNGWVEIKIRDINAYSDWSLKAGFYQNIYTLLTKSDTPASIANGQTIRVIDRDWTGTNDVAIDDNNVGKWDVKSSTTNFANSGYGAIWIEDNSGNIVDIVSYEIPVNNVSDNWLDAGGLNPLGVLTTAVGDGLWTGSTLANAFVGGDPASTTNYSLTTSASTAGGDGPSDWQNN